MAPGALITTYYHTYTTASGNIRHDVCVTTGDGHIVVHPGPQAMFPRVRRIPKRFRELDHADMLLILLRRRRNRHAFSWEKCNAIHTASFGGVGSSTLKTRYARLKYNLCKRWHVLDGALLKRSVQRYRLPWGAIDWQTVQRVIHQDSLIGEWTIPEMMVQHSYIEDIDRLGLPY
ncbi:hypothetical protein HYALB_00009312 [Hymenoscyphus albidus]|uniref:Uncharacterized protein n=1 Tax=Hymenoscyphus albidus TaxID=595503 RepID=A0A9N9LH81_9HELO|nr:hypothetical protein HYALB_00009312 [Hymenoscyphus albidus]